jgi:hypothetical protein
MGGTVDDEATPPAVRADIADTAVVADPPDVVDAELERLLIDAAQVPADRIDVSPFPESSETTRFTAEDWKRRALYENERRQHMEQELLRVRDDIDRVIRRAAVVRRDPTT